MMGKMSIIWKAGSMSPGAVGHGFPGSSLCNVSCFTIRDWKEEAEAGTDKRTTPGLIRNDVCIAHRKKSCNRKEWHRRSEVTRLRDGMPKIVLRVQSVPDHFNLRKGGK